MMILLVVVGLLFLVGAVLFIVYVAGRWPKNPGRTDTAEDEALALLRKRLAAGEITRAEFEELKEMLEHQSG